MELLRLRLLALPIGEARVAAAEDRRARLYQRHAAVRVHRILLFGAASQQRTPQA